MPRRRWRRTSADASRSRSPRSASATVSGDHRGALTGLAGHIQSQVEFFLPLVELASGELHQRGQFAVGVGRTDMLDDRPATALLDRDLHRRRPRRGPNLANVRRHPLIVSTVQCPNRHPAISLTAETSADHRHLRKLVQVRSESPDRATTGTSDDRRRQQSCAGSG